MGDYFNNEENQNSNSYSNQYTNQNTTYYNNGTIQETNPGNGFGIAALVLGILSLLCFCVGLNVVLAILAIVFGGIHIGRHKNGGNKGFGIAGIVMGIISIVFGLVFWATVIFAFNGFYYEPNDFLEEYYDTFEEYLEDSDSILDNNTF